MRRPRVPDDEIPRPSFDLDPFEPLVVEPFVASLGKSVPLVGPLPNPGLFGEFPVKFFAEKVTTLGYDEPAVVRAVRKQVDEALQAPEAGTIGVLVLMRPLCVGREIFAAVRAFCVSNEQKGGLGWDLGIRT